MQTRYIRVRINTFNPTAEGITWKTVSIYEFEVYGKKQSSGSEVWDALNNLTVKAGDKKLNLPTVEGGKVEAYADYEQIIDTDGTIYQPLEDKTVSVEFKVTDQNNKVTKKRLQSPFLERIQRPQMRMQNLPFFRNWQSGQVLPAISPSRKTHAS